MPITKMMNIERRNGEDKPVIRKALVELDGTFQVLCGKQSKMGGGDFLRLSRRYSVLRTH